jgi:hypothetical protein
MPSACVTCSHPESDHRSGWGCLAVHGTGTTRRACHCGLYRPPVGWRPSSRFPVASGLVFVALALLAVGWLAV